MADERWLLTLIDPLVGIGLPYWQTAAMMAKE
jgi:hypothetical protein